METFAKFLLSIKNAGFRKIFAFLAALLALFTLCAAKKLTGGEFIAGFIPLVAAVMGANYGEHKEKEKANVPPQPPPANP